MVHQQAYRAAVGGKHHASKATGNLHVVRRPLIAAAVLFLASVTSSPSSAQPNPFAGMAGTWHGGGTVSLVGGCGLSRIWPQLIADVLQVPITAPADPVSATAFGAFRIARRALGNGEVDSGFSVVAEPRPERIERIDRQRRRFTAGTQFARTLR